MLTVIIGMDLSKNVFVIHDVDETRKATPIKPHRQHGHTVELTAPDLVASYRTWGRRGKNDAADVAATCEAATRRRMRSAP